MCFCVLIKRLARAGGLTVTETKKLILVIILVPILIAAVA